MQNSLNLIINTLKWSRPQAVAEVLGGEAYPKINGLIKFYSLPYGATLIEAEIFYLPNTKYDQSSGFFGFHIHETGDCSDNFAKTGNHYDPEKVPHPYHAGDMPPLLSNNGYVWTAFFNSRITVPEILGRSVIIHSMPDDFTSQPSGNSGEKIACGVIKRYD